LRLVRSGKRRLAADTRRAGLRQISGRWDSSNPRISDFRAEESYFALCALAYTMPHSRNPSAHQPPSGKLEGTQSIRFAFNKKANSVILSFPDWSRRFLLCFPDKFPERLPYPCQCPSVALVFVVSLSSFHPCALCAPSKALRHPPPLPSILCLRHSHCPIPVYAFVQTSNKSRRRYNFIYSGIPR
jgi:hypothetical protein